MHLWTIITIILIFVFAEDILHMFFGPIAEVLAIYLSFGLFVALLKLATLPISQGWAYITPIIGAPVAHFISYAVCLFIALPLPYLLLIDSYRDFKWTSGIFHAVTRRRRTA